MHLIDGVLEMETAGSCADKMEQIVVTYSGANLNGMTGTLTAGLDQDQILLSADVVKVNEPFQIVMIFMDFDNRLYCHGDKPSFDGNICSGGGLSGKPESST